MGSSNGPVWKLVIASQFRAVAVNKNPKEIDTEHINKCHPYSSLSKIKDDMVFFKKKVPEIKSNAPSDVTIRVDEIIVLI